MEKTSTSLASFFRPHGGGSDDLVTVKHHRRDIKVAEIRHNSNVINIENIASTPLARDLQVTRLLLLAANLLEAGVSVIDTQGVSGTVPINVKFLGAMVQINQKIDTDAPLSTLFSNEAVFLIAEPQLMAVHKCTGNMDEMLASIARYCEEEFTALVDGLLPIIEPLMIIFVGLIIGVMMLMLYLSIFSTSETIY